MSIELLDRAATALGELTKDVVFAGAATIPLWITEPGAAPLRPTVDVDVVVEAFTLVEYNLFEQRLREAGFKDERSQIGRFLFGSESNQLDVIPADPSIIGFENRWLAYSVAMAAVSKLPSGKQIKVLPPANLLATKLEAFDGRGKNDFLGSPDFEDVVCFVDGRSELPEDVAGAPEEVKRYLSERIASYLRNGRARSAVSALLEYDRGGPERARSVVIPRLEKIAALGS